MDQHRSHVCGLSSRVLGRLGSKAYNPQQLKANGKDRATARLAFRPLGMLLSLFGERKQCRKGTERIHPLLLFNVTQMIGRGAENPVAAKCDILNSPSPNIIRSFLTLFLPSSKFMLLK